MTRLGNNSALESLKNFAGFHLGEQHHALIDVDKARRCTEGEKASLMPLMFGLMPVSAAFRESPYVEVKPIIQRHLNDIGIEPSPLLLSVIKDLCDNFDRTRFRDGPPALRPRKSSISDLRSQPDLYRRMRQLQGSRCAVCGCTFGDGQREETLDHVIPWRLGGDPPGGWNWQLLCRRCNTAKDTLLAAYLAPEYSNWIFPGPIGQPSALGLELHERGRYLALRHYGKCQDPDCEVTARIGALRVARTRPNGFSVLDHLTVLCDSHCATAHLVG